MNKQLVTCPNAHVSFNRNNFLSLMILSRLRGYYIYNVPVVNKVNDEFPCVAQLMHVGLMKISVMSTVHCEPKKRGSTFDIITLEKHARFL